MEQLYHLRHPARYERTLYEGRIDGHKNARKNRVFKKMLVFGNKTSLLPV
jgi:hypothetical protein